MKGSKTRRLPLENPAFLNATKKTMKKLFPVHIRPSQEHVFRTGFTNSGKYIKKINKNKYINKCEEFNPKVIW